MVPAHLRGIMQPSAATHARWGPLDRTDSFELKGLRKSFAISMDRGVRYNVARASYSGCGNSSHHAALPSIDEALRIGYFRRFRI